MGKSLGTDLEKQKLTLPLIRLLDQLPESEATQVRELLTHPDEQTRAALAPYLETSDAIVVGDTIDSIALEGEEDVLGLVADRVAAWNEVLGQ